MKVVMEKKGNSLVPVYSKDHEIIQKIGEGSQVIADVKKPRNPKQHRLLFALLQCVLDQQEQYKSIDELLIVLKITLGYVSVYYMDNKEIFVPKSISFESMDNIEFEDKILQPALDRFSQYLECTKEELENNYQDYM